MKADNEKTHPPPRRTAADHDGYTLIQGCVATHGTSPAQRKLSDDAVKDFSPIGMIGGTAD